MERQNFVLTLNQKMRSQNEVLTELIRTKQLKVPKKKKCNLANVGYRFFYSKAKALS